MRLTIPVQSTLLPLDPGYSDWLGFILKMINLAQLQILKLNLQVGGLLSCSLVELSTNLREGSHSLLALSQLIIYEDTMLRNKNLNC